MILLSVLREKTGKLGVFKAFYNEYLIAFKKKNFDSLL